MAEHEPINKYLGWAVTLGIGIGMSAALLYFGLYLIDIRAGRYNMGIGSDQYLRSIRTMEPYPFDGWHMQPHLRQTGDLPYERQPYHEFNIHSGSHGFFTDVDLEDPPVKEKGEFRIILTGGSGAQGWGAQTNEKMFYSLLEKRLNELTGRKVRVINLAMGSSVSYQNFIALNRWGHRLEPDLILTYSGHNDYLVPIEKGVYGTYFDMNVAGLVYATRASSNPDLLMKFGQHFPNIFGNTRLGTAIRVLLNFDDYSMQFHQRQMEEFKSAGLSVDKHFEKWIVSPYVHSLRSIKRDFDGIPILVAWQAVEISEIVQKANDFGLPPTFYDRFYAEAKTQLNGYLNKKWDFININDAFKGDQMDLRAAHAGNLGQAKIAEILAQEIKKTYLSGK